MRCLPVLAAVLLAGCVASGTTLEVHDADVFVPNLRVSIGKGDEAPSALRSGGAFELGVSQARGESTQQLGSGQRSTLGSQTFYGPQQIGTEARVTVLDAVGRVRTMGPEQKVGFELFGGLGYARYDFAVLQGGRRFEDGTGAVGLTGGVGLVWRLLPSTSAQGRFTYFASTGVTEKSEIERWDAAAVQALGRNVSLRAGYSWWELKSTRGGSSDVHARLSGPSLGLELSF